MRLASHSSIDGDLNAANATDDMTKASLSMIRWHPCPTHEAPRRASQIMDGPVGKAAILVDLGFELRKPRDRSVPGGEDKIDALDLGMDANTSCAVIDNGRMVSILVLDRDAGIVQTPSATSLRTMEAASLRRQAVRVMNRIIDPNGV